MRTEQYRYSEYVNLVDGDQELAETQAPDWTSPEDWGELYDLTNDPEETVNLVSSLYRQMPALRTNALVTSFFPQLLYKLRFIVVYLPLRF